MTGVCRLRASVGGKMSSPLFYPHSIIGEVVLMKQNVHDPPPTSLFGSHKNNPPTPSPPTPPTTFQVQLPVVYLGNLNSHYLSFI